MKVRQVSFHGGEVSPLLWGRTDLPVFGRGLRTMRNFFASREGAAVSRPGSTFIAQETGPVRLIPFVVAATTSYALAFGQGYVRFYRNGALLESAPGVPLSVATTYSYAQLADLKFAQIGDVLQLTHPAHPPRELKRFSELVWTLEEVIFATPLAYWCNLTTPFARTNPFAIVGSPIAGIDATHPAVDWEWEFTALMQRRSDGQIIESYPVPVTETYNGTTEASLAPLTDNQVVVYPDRVVTLSLPPAAVAPPLPNGWAAATDYRVLSYIAYRGRGDLKGFVGTTTTSRFTDAGNEPDYGLQPPRGTNPFFIAGDQAGGTDRMEYPRSVGFFEQRRVFAGLPSRPGVVLPSATGDFFNYDQKLIHTADEALEFELASTKRETIKDALGQDRYIIGTDASIWSMQGVQGSPLSFDSYYFRQEVGIGINHMPFLVVDNGAVLFVRAKGHGVRDLQFEVGRAGLDSKDISNGSSHLFIGQVLGFPIKVVVGLLGPPIITITSELVQRELVDWTYAEDPWGVVWAVRNDGKLLSLTYARGGYAAWARHDTDGGYLSVCAIPEAQEDGVYVAVYRTLPGSVSTACYIERMTSRVQAGRATDGNALDSAVLYQGVATATITGLGHLEGKTVYATGPGLPVYGVDAPLVVSGGSITLPETPDNNTLSTGFFGTTSATSLTLYVGLAFTADLETLDLAQSEVRGEMKNVERVFFEVDNSRGLKVGEDFTTLSEWEPREVSDSYSGEGVHTELVEMVVASSWNQGGRAALRQSLPIATTVVALQRKVKIGG